MNTASVPVKTSIRRRLAALVVPLCFHVWPVLLFISQKALIIPALLASDQRSSVFKKSLLLSLLLTTAGGLVLLAQRSNEYALDHLLGFGLFTLALPAINAAIKEDRARLLSVIAWISLLNSALAYVFYFMEIDLSNFRGLNRIIGSDGITYRVYFETTSLIAVFGLRGFRSAAMKFIAALLVLAYALLLAKSIFVILLIVINYVVPPVLAQPLRKKLLYLGGSAIAMLTVLAYLFALRPDFALSVAVKLFQWQEITDDISWNWVGAGWGDVIDDIANNVDQPYQVEMQLPMLVHQAGVPFTVLFAAVMFLQLRTLKSGAIAYARTLTYLIIGFSNPWLFIPSWYLTAALMYEPIAPEKK